MRKFCSFLTIIVCISMILTFSLYGCRRQIALVEEAAPVEEKVAEEIPVEEREIEKPEEVLEEVEETINKKAKDITGKDPDTATRDDLKDALDLIGEAQKMPDGKDIEKDLWDWANEVLESMAEKAIINCKNNPRKESYQELVKIWELSQHFGSKELQKRLEDTECGQGYVAKLKKTITQVSTGNVVSTHTLTVEAYTCGNNPYNEWSGTAKLIAFSEGIKIGGGEETFIIPEGGGDFSFKILFKFTIDFPPDPVDVPDSFIIPVDGRLSENTLTISITPYTVWTPELVVSGPIEEDFEICK